MLERLPEHMKTRRTADAVMAPSAIVAGGAGAAVGVLVGLGPVAVVTGLLAYAAVVAFRLPWRKKQQKVRIEPAQLVDPWRQFVREALSSQRRFREVVKSTRSGPIRDRLAEIGARIDAGVEECWFIAQRGQAISRGAASLDVESVRRELARHREGQPSRGTAAAMERDQRDGGAWQRTADALQAQIDSAERLAAVARDAVSRLRLLDARLDEAVARAVELSLSAGDVSELSGLGTDVDQLVGEMESLRLGLEEVGRVQRGSTAGGVA